MEPTPLTEALDLSSKTAIVTGAAMGIGLGIAWRFAEAGARIIIADTNQAAADEAAARIVAKGWQAAAIKTDVSDQAQVMMMVEETSRRYGGIDILVNNAGIYPITPVMEMTPDTFDHIFAINLKGVFLCSKAAAAQMIRQGRGGKIINISSIDALHPSIVGFAAYDASKHGVWGFTKNLALELAPHHIWVNAIAPGGISTPGTGAGKPVSKEREETIRSFLAKIPMRRMGEPDDIGKVALFLASKLSDYMTGSQVVVDGGVLLA